MICLTGDLHHQSLGTGNQAHCPLSEIEVARRYVALLREYGVKVTFFISGLSFRDQWPEVEPIAADPLVEIGGHNFDCFEPAIVHRVWKKIGRSYPGPEWMERRDIARTVEIIARRTGRRIRLWRDHMYMHGPNTNRLLVEQGIWGCSDVVSATAAGPRLTGEGLVEVPINVIPDHEHLIHAERTPAWIAAWQRRYRWRDAFGPDSYPIERWTELVLEQLRQNEARGAVTTMIIHPITMWLCDELRSMRRILEYIASRPNPHLGEIVAAAGRGTRIAAPVAGGVA